MKKAMGIILAMVMALSMLGCGAKPENMTAAGQNGENSAKPEEKSEGENSTKNRAYRVLTNYADNNKTHIIFQSIVEKYQQEVNPDFKVEYEVITSTNDLWDKVRLYFSSGDLPDVFNLMNGPIAEEMIAKDMLVDMTDALSKEGKLELMSPAIKDFFTSKDGKLYMLPSSRMTELFVYRKAIFEKYGLSEPSTWNEFIDVCQVLKENGEIPYIMRGDSADMYLRFLSYPTWSAGGAEFLNSMINQEISYMDDESAMIGANLLYTLGSKDYFIPGYESLNIGDCVDAFIGGAGVITNINSNFIYLLDDLYESGEIGYFSIGIPKPDGVVTTGCTFMQHGGKSWAFNNQTYQNDPEFSKFVAYYINNVDEASYEAGCMSWYETEVPEGKLSAFMGDVANDLVGQEVGWVSWDDKLEPTVFSEISDAAEKLAHGVIGPEDFGKVFDEAIAKSNN